MNTIYKICTATEWREAERAGVYRGSAVDHKDGFIHFSTGRAGLGNRGEMVCRPARSRAGRG